MLHCLRLNRYYFREKDPMQAAGNVVCVLRDCCLLSGFEQRCSPPRAESLTWFSGWWQRYVFLVSVAYCVLDVCFTLLCLPRFTLQLVQHTAPVIGATFLLQGWSFLDWDTWGPGSDHAVRFRWMIIQCWLKSLLDQPYAPYCQSLDLGNSYISIWMV